MQQLTNSANTRDWLETTGGLPIPAYVEPQSSVEGHPFSGDDLEAVVRKTAQSRKSAPTSMRRRPTQSRNR